MSGDPAAALCERLATMRVEIVAEMPASGYSAGFDAMLAQFAAALDALGETPGSPPRYVLTAGVQTMSPAISSSSGLLREPSCKIGAARLRLTRSGADA